MSRRGFEDEARARRKDVDVSVDAMVAFSAVSDSICVVLI